MKYFTVISNRLPPSHHILRFPNSKLFFFSRKIPKIHRGLVKIHFQLSSTRWRDISRSSFFYHFLRIGYENRKSAVAGLCQKYKSDKKLRKRDIFFSFSFPKLSNAKKIRTKLIIFRDTVSWSSCIYDII